MGLDIGGYDDRPDWPKMGPSLLIATCLILAIRTARWPSCSNSTASEYDLDQEIDHAAYLAGRVFARLVASHPSIFPNVKQPWYQANDEDLPK
jgi:hypothetical protein